MNVSYAPCDFERQDDPRFNYAVDTFAPPAGTWAPDCGHPACVEDAQNCPESEGWHDWDCPVAKCRWDTAHDVCDLPAGHASEHHFTLDPQAPAATSAAHGHGGA